MDEAVAYYLQGNQGTIFFTPETIVYDLVSGPGTDEDMEETQDPQRYVLALRPLGASGAVRLQARHLLPGRMNYYLGNDPKSWRTDVPTFSQIVYEELYPGIDLELYGASAQMEYDFVVRPGAKPETIRVAVDGADGLYVDGEGNLILETPVAEMKHLAPLVYQEIEGQRRAVEGTFWVTGNEFGFDVGPYDTSQPLVIDPPTLVYSTYLAEYEGTWQTGKGIAVDTDRDAYVTGSALRPGFSSATDTQYSAEQDWDVFVSSYGSEGTRRWTTIVGGSKEDRGEAIAVFPGTLNTPEPSFVAGWSWSDDFPTLLAYQRKNKGWRDAVVFKLSASGKLVYSTYLGGGDDDRAFDIAVTKGYIEPEDFWVDEAWVTGQTIGRVLIDGTMERNKDFPVFYCGSQGQCESWGFSDAFLSKLRLPPRPSGYYHLYQSLILGCKHDKIYNPCHGDDDEAGTGIAIDEYQRAWVTGWTDQELYTVTTDTAYQPDYGGGARDAFVTKVWGLPNIVFPIAYSTFLGGSGTDSAFDIAIRERYYFEPEHCERGLAYVTGATTSTNFPIRKPAYQETHAGGGTDAFITAIDLADKDLDYSTYLGGSMVDAGYSIATLPSGAPFVTGLTESSDLPTKHALQNNLRGLNDAFVASLDMYGHILEQDPYYVSYLGGTALDWGEAIAVDSRGDPYLTGATQSDNFPTKDPAQDDPAGWQDAFVTKLQWSGDPAINQDFDDGIIVGNWVAVPMGAWVVVILNPAQEAETGLPVDGHLAAPGADGAYQMTGTGADVGAFSHYYRDLNDFSYQVDVRKVSGDNSQSAWPYGLYLRSDGSQLDYYEFSITVDGLYRVGKSVNGHYQKLVDYTHSAALKTGYGSWNTLKAVADGSKLSFFANGTLLTTIKDGEYGNGLIGLFAIDAADSTARDVLQFDNVIVRGPQPRGSFSTYLPLAIKSHRSAAAPVPGAWSSSGGSVEFTVNPGATQVHGFRAWVDLPGCGKRWITHSAPVPIVNGAFGFTGSFYASGTFGGATTASGTMGLKDHQEPGCGQFTATGSWAAAWQHSGASSPASGPATGESAITFEVAPSR